MGRGCRGSHRAKRNRKGVLQPERVRTALGYCILLVAGQRDSVWGCGFAAELPLNQIPHPKQLRGRLPRALVLVAWHRFGCMGRPGQRASPSQPSSCRAWGQCSSSAPSQLPAHPEPGRAGEGREVLQPVPAAGTEHMPPEHSRALGGEPGLGLRGEQSIFCSGVPSEHLEKLGLGKVEHPDRAQPLSRASWVCLTCSSFTPSFLCLSLSCLIADHRW